MHHTHKRYATEKTAAGSLSTKISSAKSTGHLMLDVHYPRRTAIIHDPHDSEAYYLFMSRKGSNMNYAGTEASWFVLCRRIDWATAQSMIGSLEFITTEMERALES